MAQRIAAHPPVRRQFVEHLVDEGAVTQEQADELMQRAWDSIKAAHEQLKQSFGSQGPAKHHDRTPALRASTPPCPRTGYAS
jgi:2-oxoglutarate dehydrogenase complex dehydrogenase (E1) component-like enzyme